MRQTVVAIGLLLAGFLTTYFAVNRARRPDPGVRAPTSVASVAERPTAAQPAGMIWIPGGEFTMGSDSPDSPPAERPAHRVRVDDFWMDATEVTNGQFRAFVAATGYATTAERPVDWELIESATGGEIS